MINFDVNFRRQNYYYLAMQTQEAELGEQTSYNKNGREVVTSWKYDEEGNIVYYTYDKNSGEILTQTKYKNPYKNIVQPK